MFLDLINLYNKNNNSNRTPFEDFNTECFANILRLYENIKIDFITNFLQLPDDNYSIHTQLKKDLPEDPNCIIDLVFIGERNICFIENKVESQEGWEQLLRYGKVLDIHYKELKTHLVYCTKYSDLKNKNGEYSKYNFKQYKWFEVAKFLRKYQITNPLINEYLIFLNSYKMAQDNTIKAENLLSMENMLKTIEVAEFHIDNCKQEFTDLFGYFSLNKNSNWDQLRDNNRFCHYKEGILNSPVKAHSEVLYSIEFSTLQLRSQIYVNSNNLQFKEFKNMNYDNNIFRTQDFGSGFCFYLSTDLGKFLNNNNSDLEIKAWFTESFVLLDNLIKSNPKLDWNI